MEDDKIIELFFLRSEAAIQKLDTKYGRLLKSISSNLLPSVQDVEECVNDTLMKVWTEIPPAKPDNLMAFVCKIARRTAMNSYKHMHRKKRCGEMDFLLCELDECIPSREDICRELEEKQTLALINQWLAGLDDKTQALFVRRYFFMDSVSQLSKAFSLSQSNVSTILYRARKDLKNFLLKEGIAV